MRYLKVASVSLNQTPLDWAHNKANILQAIKRARQADVTLLCCPELSITGYGCEDMFLALSTSERALSDLNEIAGHTKGMIVAVGLPVLHRDGLFNTACLLVDGKIAGFVAKQHLAGSGIHYEPRWFKAWPANKIDYISFNGDTYPIGDLLFELGNVRLGFEICEDAWVAERTGVNLARRGVDLILNPSASHFAFGKAAIRKRLVQEGSRAFSVGYIYANLLGLESGRVIYDGDTLIAADGELLTMGTRFSFEDQVLSTAVLDIQNLRLKRTGSVDHSTVLENNKTIISVPFVFNKNLTREEISLPVIPWEQSKHLKEEEFMRAVSLGLFDYLRKSHLKGFVLNLSGGADSGACACLVYFMIRLGLQELGEESFQKKLPDISFGKTGLDISDYLKKLFYCLYQQTENNADTTLSAAVGLSKALDFPLFNLQIDLIVKAYSDLMQPIVDRSLNWDRDDMTLQNIQSRARGPSAWMLANIRDAILLCTSNRSEASVGYTTMDGDTCGGLSPLAGVDKHFILQWLQWLEKEGPVDFKPIKALKEINAQLPTAELRPKSMAQTDEADLMPYTWLDIIEHAFVRDKKSPLEILLIMQKLYPTENIRMLATSIERFFTRWAKYQWKRERLAPAFHVDDENVDPKTGCRFPILSGGFKEELAEMWSRV